MIETLRAFFTLRNVLASLALALCWQIPVTAQGQAAPGDGPLWYQVELIIFERRQGTAGGPDTEEWPRNIALAYPPNVRHLTEPGEQVTQSGKSTSPANSSVTESGETAIQEQPFTLLGRDQLELAGSARGIERQSNLRILFHQAWRQPMVPFQQAPAIIISGGEKYDEHHELEGSVTFSVSRYLHMHTNLWLTEFEANYGQAIGQWPPLPRPPQKLNELSGDELTVDVGLTETPPVFSPWGSNETRNKENNFRLNQKGNAFEQNNYGYLSQKPFVTKNIVTLQQQRRMRSEELHYVDHPRLGILVSIKAYDPTGNPNDGQSR